MSRCDERLKARVEESTCLTYTGLHDKPKPKRKSEDLVKAPPTIVSRLEEDAALKTCVIRGVTLLGGMSEIFVSSFLSYSFQILLHAIKRFDEESRCCHT